jgi:hypothetical protein
LHQQQGACDENCVTHPALLTSVDASLQQRLELFGAEHDAAIATILRTRRLNKRAQIMACDRFQPATHLRCDIVLPGAGNSISAVNGRP